MCPSRYLTNFLKMISPDERGRMCMRCRAIWLYACIPNWIASSFYRICCSSLHERYIYIFVTTLFVFSIGHFGVIKFGHSQYPFPFCLHYRNACIIRSLGWPRIDELCSHWICSDLFFHLQLCVDRKYSCNNNARRSINSVRKELTYWGCAVLDWNNYFQIAICSREKWNWAYFYDWLRNFHSIIYLERLLLWLKLVAPVCHHQDNCTIYDPNGGTFMYQTLVLSTFLFSSMWKTNFSASSTAAEILRFQQTCFNYKYMPKLHVECIL